MAAIDDLLPGEYAPLDLAEWLFAHELEEFEHGRIALSGELGARKGPVSSLDVSGQFPEPCRRPAPETGYWPITPMASSSSRWPRSWSGWAIGGR